MSGHSKWSQIKRQKAVTDAKKSKIFSKHARLITAESKKTGGQINASLNTIIENAKKDNVPKEVIERAIKKGTESGIDDAELITYESYGPGGSAILIDVMTSNRNKSAQEVKHALSKNGFSLASQGSASWAFKREQNSWVPINTLTISEDETNLLEKLVDDLENLDEVEEVFTNVE